MILYFCKMVSIVRLTTADTELLSKMGGTSLIESHGHSATPQIMQEYVDKNFRTEACRNELIDESNIFYAIFYNNEPAGYYKIILNKPHPAVALQPVTYMERLYLLSRFYNLKLGQQLMQHAVNLSKNSSEKGMWLTVWQKNERALRFYQKAGFAVVEEGKFVLTEKYSNPTWVMMMEY